MFINNNYIATKVNGQKGEGRDLRDKYQVRGYPTVLLLNSAGEEIDRIFGWKNEKDSYFATLVDYTNGKNTIADIQSRLTKDSLNAKLHYQMAKKFTGRWELDRAQIYLENVLKLDPEDQLGYGEESLGYLAIQHLYDTGDDSRLLDFIQHTSNIEYIEKGYQVLIRYYKSQKFIDKVVKAYENALIRLNDESNLMNGYAWYIYENKLEDRYNSAVTYARKALSIRPKSAHIWDTLAWLEFESGDIDSAIAHMRVAINLDPDDQYFQKNLNHFLERK